MFYVNEDMNLGQDIELIAICSLYNMKFFYVENEEDKTDFGRSVLEKLLEDVFKPLVVQ